jgi:O-antigen ligase
VSLVYGAQRTKTSPVLALYFVVFSGSIYLLFGTFEEGSLSGKSGQSLAYLGLLLVTYSVLFYQLALVRGVALGKLVKSPAVMMFVCSGFVSLLTADAATISAIRFCLYVLTCTTGLLISARYSLDEFCESFFWTSFAITAAYLLAYPFLASRLVYDSLYRETVLGITSYAGLFPHKSVAATFFSLSVIISLARFFGASGLTTRRSSMTLACTSAVALLMSGAIGRLLFLLVSVAAGLPLRAYFRRNVASLILLSAAFALAFGAYLSIGNSGLLEFFGRGGDLTGRAELFELWPRFFLDKPVFGYGFDGFFTDIPGSPGAYLSDLAEGKGFSTFESVYLDLLIEFGLVGSFFFACILLSALRKAIRYYKTGTSKYKFVPLLLMIWSIFGSLLDSGVLTQNSLACVVVFWIYFGVDRFNQAPSGTNRNFKRRGISRDLISQIGRRQRLPGALR